MLIMKKECRDFKGVKKYNSVIAMKEETGVFIRDSTCSFCESCQQGDVMNCTSEKNGKYKNHIVKRSIWKDLKMKKTPINEVIEVEDEEEDEESDEEYEFEREDER